jgi:hypothetical protein
MGTEWFQSQPQDAECLSKIAVMDADLQAEVDLAVAEWKRSHPNLVVTAEGRAALLMPGRCGECLAPVRLSFSPMRWLNADGSRHACVTALRA